MNGQICPLSSPYKQIGEIVKARRKELGLTQTDLAQAAGVNRRSVRRLENGERMQVDFWEMLAYQQVLGPFKF